MDNLATEDWLEKDDDVFQWSRRLTLGKPGRDPEVAFAFYIISGRNVMKVTGYIFTHFHTSGRDHSPDYSEHSKQWHERIVDDNYDR